MAFLNPICIAFVNVREKNPKISLGYYHRRRFFGGLTVVDHRVIFYRDEIKVLFQRQMVILHLVPRL